MNRFAVTALVSALALTAGYAAEVSAATVFDTPGDVFIGVNWDNGLPGTGNDGTIDIDGALYSDPVWNAGTYSITSSANIITTGTNSSDGFNLRVGGGALTWDMTGGSILARFFLANGSGVTFNMSGGTIVLSDVTSTQYIGTANSGTLNISGSAVLDATQATAAFQTGGSIDIASNWTGYWTHGTYSGSEWRNHFIDGDITYNGITIDDATFDATFEVTDGGATLALVPEPGSLALLSLGGLCLLKRRRRA